MPVATRRKAQGEKLVAQPDPELALRKKPIRKPTARTADTKAAKPIATTKTTRRKQADPEAAEVVSLPSSEQPAKATRRTTTRSKDDAPGAALEQAASEETLRTRDAQDDGSTIHFSRKPKPIAVDKTAKPSRAGSVLGGRPAPPLSPKKVNQVGRASTRQVTAATTERVPTKRLAKPAASRATRTRKKQVGDENRSIPSYNEGNEGQDEEGAGTPKSSTETTADQSSMHGAAADIEPEAVVSKQPKSKTRQQLPRQTSRKEVARRETPSRVSPSKRKQYESDSEDELNGPKTPMRRCSPGAAKRYQASVRDTIRRLGTAGKMSVHREASCSPSKRVRLSPQRPIEHTPNPDNMTEDPSSGCGEGDVSFYPDENILELDDAPQDYTDQTVEHTTAFSTTPATKIDDSDATIVVTEHAQDDAEVSEFNDSQAQTSHMPGLFDTPSTRLSSMVNPVETLQPNETSTLDDGPEASGLEEYTLENNGEVIIPRLEPSQHATFQPETLIWENIRQDITINVDFDKFLSNARPAIDSTPTDAPESSPVKDLTSMLSCSVEIEMTRDEPQPEALAASCRRESLNLNEFVDVAALSEKTSPIRTPSLRSVEANPEHISAEMQSENNIIETNLNGPETSTTNSAIEPEELAETPIAPAVAEIEAYPEVPHYALSTFAFDTRRKSLPNLYSRTPIRGGARPNTSDGATLPRMTTQPAWPISRRGSISSAVSCSTPCRSRPSTSHGYYNISKPSTPNAKSPRHIGRVTPFGGFTERRPLFAPNSNYHEHMQTITVPSRFRPLLQSPAKRRRTMHAVTQDREAQAASTPVVTATIPKTTSSITPQDRHPRLASRATYEHHLDDNATPKSFGPTRTPGSIQTKIEINRSALSTPRLDSPSGKLESPKLQDYPITTPKERYPQSWACNRNRELAKTVAAPARFHTPLETPPRRPGTGQKRDTLRKAAMTAHASNTSNTPIKSPQRLPLTTPSVAPMTPHPSAPLRGVVALVEVFTLEGASASNSFTVLLRRLGAKTTRTWAEQITHVVFKDGSPTTLQRVRLHNKSVIEAGTGTEIHCVNSRWVTDCDHHGVRHDESAEEYAVDVTEVPRGGKRRRKSMEPSTLMQINGNVVRDRKVSLGRSSLSKSSLKSDSPVAQAMSSNKGSAVKAVTSDDIENAGEATTPTGGDSRVGDVSEMDSPCTPAWIAAPDTLVQQTAPMNRVRKLGVKGDGAVKNRRLTFWNGRGV